ncbi:unnamed protein product [Victoria cruziana]
MGIQTVGFVGVDDLCLDITFSLVRSGFRVQGFDRSNSIMDGFVKLGGSNCSVPVEVGRGSAAIIITVSDYKQAYDLLFGVGGIIEGLASDTVIILRSDISPEDIEKLQKHLKGKMII